ncbi:hypothetical protein [Derxia lacustris]|uniref:hypothetical protein n=1 Tax=Derxia lacustris TaxID=764842 RepID=UPI000A176818|nr:hypothetical protein [Derxia lacustris]
MDSGKRACARTDQAGGARGPARAHTGRARRAGALALVALALVTGSGAALAQPRGPGGPGGGFGGAPGGGGPGGGRWLHGGHDGYFGWWWVAGPVWYLWSLPPARPEPPVTTVIVETAPPAASVATAPAPAAVQPSWYWCEASRAYYPYVASCTGGWKQVPAVPPAPGDGSAVPPSTPAPAAGSTPGAAQ